MGKRQVEVSLRAARYTGIGTFALRHERDRWKRTSKISSAVFVRLNPPVQPKLEFIRRM
jgi:hypothetical protein